MSSRRNFIGKTALLAGAILWDAKMARAAAPLPTMGEDEEAYWKKIRAEFPLTHKKIYLNNGTLGPSPYTVLEAVQQHMQQVDRDASHGKANEQALEALASLLKVSETELSLTHNVTEGINIVCWGLGLKAGDEVIITNQEHAGSASPWLNRWKLSGIKLVVINVGFTAEETLGNIGKAISTRTKLIAVPHMPCTTGAVLPIKIICDMARGNGILTLIDGAHPPGMLSLDLKDLGCDFYASCCHKWLLGPKGTGFLYIAARQRDAVQAYYGGAGVDKGWDLADSKSIKYSDYAADGHRYYYGTQNESLYVGIEKAVDFQLEIGQERIAQRVKSLAQYLQEHLMTLSPNIEMLTPTESISRGAIVAFRFRNGSTKDFHNYCYGEHIVTRFVPENKMDCLRLSTHIYNSFDEVDIFLQTVERFLYTQKF